MSEDVRSLKRITLYEKNKKMEEKKTYFYRIVVFPKERQSRYFPQHERTKLVVWIGGKSWKRKRTCLWQIVAEELASSALTLDHRKAGQ